jgi:sigma-B regulation protein RsbU (phosphoserine phosphatase)
MLQRSARLQYILLALVAGLALSHFYVGVANNFRNLAHGHTRPRPPFATKELRPILDILQPEAAAAGLRPGDTVLTVNGHPFTGRTILVGQVRSQNVGQPFPVTWTRPGDPAVHTGSILLAPERDAPASISLWLLRGVLLFFPLLFLLIGIWVVFARPRNPHAWLIFGILAYFVSLFIGTSQLPGSLFFPLAVFWNAVEQTAMALCLMFFGVYFPQRSPLDVRHPSVKWVLTIAILAFLPYDLLYYYSANWSFSTGKILLPQLYIVNLMEWLLAAGAIFWFFAALTVKLGSVSGDARRRLVVLLWGSGVGLAPFLAMVLHAAIRNTDLGQSIAQWDEITILLILLLFPLTLAYVVVVQRAMDLRVLIRQGTKYFFARSTLVGITLLLAGWMSYVLSVFVSNPKHRRPMDFVHLFVIVGLFFAFRFVVSKRLQQRIDQKFFREAYSAEQLLSELSEQARNFTEVEPLLDTITQRIGSTLHIDRIAVFLRSGNSYRLQLAMGIPVSGAMMPPILGSLSLAETSATITNLARGRAPATVYPDDPSSWLVEATEAERTALHDLSTELLVPLPGRHRLAGVMALGPKRSEEPYTRTDRQLLQSVGTQTGLALENAELFENLSSEIAHRERVSREIEIAREVQERLFPQEPLSLGGVDVAGFCRPAQVVGGDYYDFFLLPGSAASEKSDDATRLGLALGDISGKGISAALLMAGLRASLRSAAQLQPGDLARLMSHVNRLVYDSSTANRYATFFYAEYDSRMRLLTYVNAGHNPPVILRGEAVLPLEATGTVIGLLPDTCFTSAELLLHPGDVLLAFTDGISEAMNAAEEEWGEERMIAAARTLLHRPDCITTAEQLLQCVFQEADRFTTGAPQHDDMALLVCMIH